MKKLFGVEREVISKSSWHFRWLQFIHFVKVESFNSYNLTTHKYEVDTKVSAPKSICPYFWLLMSSFVLTLIGIGVVGMILLLVGTILFDIYWLISHYLTQTLKIVGITAAVAVLVLVFRKVLLWVFKYRPAKPKQRRDSERGISTFSLLFKYIKARKNKVCPMVEFVD